MKELEKAQKDFEYLDHIPVGACVLRRDSVVLFWNRSLEDWTGIKRSEIIGKNIGDHFPHLNSPKYAIRLKDIFEGGPPTIFSSQLHRYVIPSPLPNGQLRIQHTTVTPLSAPDGSGFYALLAIQDVTDLTKSVQDYRDMRDKALEEIKERTRVEEELLKVREGLELRVKERTADLVAMNEQLQKEIAERRQAEGALRKSENKYRTLFENSMDAIYITSRSGEFVDVNNAALELFGYTREEMIGLNAREIYADPEDRRKFQLEIERKGSVRDYEIRCRRKDGTEMVCLVTSTVRSADDGTILGYEGIFRNITERKKMEEDLLNARKLESVGILAGGLAHDFNNLLTAIIGNISLARMYIEPQNQAYEKLTEAERASLRAKDLTRQLLTFSLGGAPVKKTMVITDVIKESANFAVSGSHARCDISVVPDLWPVEIDEGQIGQVINNIVINAYQSMSKGGIITVRAENAMLRPGEIPNMSSGGKYVKISISDKGCGIPEELFEKIFDPYFTTKEGGSGLGLATSYSIVKSHNGCIQVRSSLGAGSTFTVYLPAAEGDISVEKEPKKEIIGSGKVLVMDDEEMIRIVAGGILRRIGYGADFARDGREAIEMYKSAKEAGEPFDAVIVDLTIPGGMGGKDAIKKLIEVDPDVKAIVSSGYSNDPIMAEFRKYGFSGVVVKPYTISEISEVLHAVLSRTQSSTQ